MVSVPASARSDPTAHGTRISRARRVQQQIAAEQRRAYVCANFGCSEQAARAHEQFQASQPVPMYVVPRGQGRANCSPQRHDRVPSVRAARLPRCGCLALRVRDRLELFQRPYWHFLLVPWKVGSFAIAASAMVLIAPYTGDPTWDAVDASFMSVLAFTTAPWAVGTIYRWLFGRSTGGSAYIAACVWLFS